MKSAVEPIASDAIGDIEKAHPNPRIGKVRGNLGAHGTRTQYGYCTNYEAHGFLFWTKRLGKGARIRLHSTRTTFDSEGPLNGQRGSS